MGEEETGVTLHWLSAEADAGDIIAQQRVTFPLGVDGPAAERLAAEAAANLLVTTLSGEQLGRCPQPVAGASYQSSPTAADRTITVEWSAERAFCFLRGASDYGPLFLDVGGERFTVRQALEYASEGELSQPTVREGAVTSVQMAPGILRLLLAR
jgi:UDP-4-amino-4-deoxy-L-arabinose formyltransferase/UDP-glucuronic acid dehydrogenase (UDP-4-keto-hexauronic acid decarboxylating)